MKKSLVLIDFQNDFISGSLGTKEAQDIIPLVIEKVKKSLESNIFVYFTLDTHDNNYLNTTEGKNLPVEHCIKNTQGHQLHPEIASLLINYKENTHYAFIEKHFFSSVNLIEEFKKNACNDVELIGICTDICVVSNALLLKAHYPDMHILVDSSCCAGVTVEKHLAALEVLKSCHIKVD